MARDAVLADMGIGQNADGEMGATEAQWAEIDRRTTERLKQMLPAPNPKPNQPLAQSQKAQAAQADELSQRGKLVADFVQAVISGSAHQNSIRLGPISANAGRRMATKTSAPVQGAVEIVIADSVIHANKRHPDLTLADWARLPEVTNAFDDVSLGRPGQNQSMTRIVVRKSTQEDGAGYGAVYDFAAGGSKGRKKLNLVTYFRGTEKSLNAWWEKNKGADPAAAPNYPEPASSARDGVSAPSRSSVPPTNTAAQPITSTDVAPAQQQAVVSGAQSEGARAFAQGQGAMFSRAGNAGTEAERQFKETERAYGGRAAYDRAKAAGKTKLTYGQWVQVRTPNFKAWFGYDWEQANGQGKAVAERQGATDSGVDRRATSADVGGRGAVRQVWGLDSSTGEPKTWLHGTKDEIAAFDLNHPNRKDVGWLGEGIYITDSADMAAIYANNKRGDAGENLMPLFAAVRNPYVADLSLKKRLRKASKAQVRQFTQEVQAAGYDGVVLQVAEDAVELLAFDPTQVKSATGNNGEFDGTNSDIRFSRAQQPMSPDLARAILALGSPPKQATKESVRAAVRELVNGLGLLPNRLGRIVVATSAEIKQDWGPLIGPTDMEASGDAGRAQGFYDPKSKTVFLIADNIRQGHELGVVAHELMHKHGPAVLGEDGWNRLMRAASFMFHHAEKFNRQVTFVAAYRLARETGADNKVAYTQAVQATYDGHFDYSSNNRPRVMQGNAARVLLLFKQYGQNMVYTLVRNAQQSLKGATPQERAQARKALGGLLTMHGMAAGALGLPMVTTLLAAASMLGGDDDEPWDAQVALQNMLADTFGQKPAEVLSHGLSRLTPWDISGRVGLDKLILPDIQEGLEGQRLGESAMAAALGPVAGIVVNLFKGVEEMGEGRYVRGLETMMPTALRSPLKALRYGTEGVRDKSGIVVQDEVDAAELLGQAAGFSPSSVRNSFEGKSAIVAHDRALQARRSALVEQFAMAAMARDEEGKADARAAIAKFNEKNPGRRILPMQLAQSVRMRTKRIEQAQDGVYLPTKRRDAMDVGRFATGE